MSKGTYQERDSVSETVTEPKITPPVVNAGGKLTVVLADSDVASLAALRGTLESDGVSVVAEARDANQAVDAAMRHRPNVCLLDLGLPGDALAATRQIHRALPTTKVAVLGRAVSEDFAFPAIRAGADGYLVKGRAMTRLASALRAVANGEPALPRALSSSFVRDLRVSSVPARARTGDHGRINRTVLYLPRFIRHFRRRLRSDMSTASAWHSTRVRMREYATSRNRG
jgi:DNA-binding NarL/FixJ family response regulator